MHRRSTPGDGTACGMSQTMRKSIRFGTVWLVVATAVGAPLRAGEHREAAPVDFAREILPVLSDKCFVCHGPDGEGTDRLRLDSFAAATRDLGGYRAIDPDAPGESEILVRIHSADDPMPPADAEKKLTSAEHAACQSLGPTGRRVRHALGVCSASKSTAGRQGWRGQAPDD